MRKLDDFYASLNTFLADQGINPGIEEQVEKHGSVLNLRKKNTPPRPDKDRSKNLEEKVPKLDQQAEPANSDNSAQPNTGDWAGRDNQFGAGNPPNQAASNRTASNQGASNQGASTQVAHNSQGALAGSAGGAPAGPAGTNFGASANTTGATGGMPQSTANIATPDFSAGRGAQAAPAQAPAAEVGAGPSSPHFNPDTLYRSVIEALNFQHQHAGGEAVSGAGGGSAGTAMPADAGGTGNVGSQANPAMLAAALSSLQHNPQVRSEVQSSQSLREYLSDNQGKIAGLKGTDGIGAQSLNQLDLVDNLFGSLRTDIDVARELQDSLGDLHIPLAKLALMEPQFFVDEQHPARGVIDKLALLSSSANYPNKALENRVSGVVDNIIQGYETDSGVFGEALTDLTRLVDQQEMALERNVQRVVKTQDGQQKLLRAQLAVEKLLSSRIRPPRAPKLMLDLVEHGWRDLLTLTHVKEGPHSRSWRDYTKTLDLLSLWLIEQQKGISDEQLQMERALEAEPFVDMIRQQVNNALPSNVALDPVLEELLEVLSGRAAVELVEIEQAPFEAKASPAETRQRIETLPRLRRWVKRVEELEAGVWLRFRDEAGKKRRMQLAWISEEKDRYVFVNERGQKMADLSNVELARQLSRGVKPPSPSEKLSLVDQSMYNTLETVQKTLSFDNNRDSLTKLINKKAFLGQLELMLNQAKTRHSQHGIIYIDIDQFALVNEVYDEVTGDQVLSEFARLLAQQHSDKISSARLEDDKFAVLLKDRSVEQTVAHAEKIRSDIELSPITIDTDSVSFTVSIGVATVQDFHDSVEQVMANAEFAMRKAKADGRNKVVEFRDQQSLADEYKSIESAAIAKIENTLKADSFELRAQAIVQNVENFADLPVKYYEVLLGIKDGHGELASPQDFIVSAERFGYMVEVDRWIVNEVFAWIARQMDDQREIPNLSINLSGTSISDDRFMDYLFEKISDYGVGTNRICFEITETGTISNMTKAADFVRALKNIGCRFSIDDFGTGLASHNYLRELPVDYLKIDGTFIATIHQNDKDYAMVKSINDLAHFLGQQTIAEFVENDHIIDSLRTIGVDYLQGWGVSKPIPLSELTKSLPRLQT